jgi:hypothetical protein
MLTSGRDSREPLNQAATSVSPDSTMVEAWLMAQGDRVKMKLSLIMAGSRLVSGPPDRR